MLQKAFPHNVPDVAVVQNIIDFKSFFEGHLLVYSGHTGREGGRTTGGPHAFQFKLFECPDGKYVGFQTRTLASQLTKPWLGDGGNADPRFAIPVFQSLPPLDGVLPKCNEPVRLPSTLDQDIATLEKWLTKARTRLSAKVVHSDSAAADSALAPLVEQKDQLDTRGKDAVEWFQTVKNTRALGAQPVAELKSSGVGSAATLRSAVHGCDVSVRVIGFDGRFDIPEFGPRPSVVAAPRWVFEPNRAAKSQLIERKDAKDASERDHKHCSDVSDEVVRLAAEPVGSAALANLEQQSGDLAMASGSAANAQTDAEQRVEPSPPQSENVVRLKRRKCRTASAHCAKAAPLPAEKKTAKRARVSNDSLDTGRSFEQVKQLFDKGQKLEVWYRLDKDPSVIRWRCEIKAIHEASKTFDARAIEHGVDLAGIEPCRLTKRTALAV